MCFKKRERVLVYVYCFILMVFFRGFLLPYFCLACFTHTILEKKYNENDFQIKRERDLERERETVITLERKRRLS